MRIQSQQSAREEGHVIVGSTENDSILNDQLKKNTYLEYSKNNGQNSSGDDMFFQKMYKL